jgi:hypothetical protein
MSRSRSPTEERTFGVSEENSDEKSDYRGFTELGQGKRMEKRKIEVCVCFVNVDENCRLKNS